MHAKEMKIVNLVTAILDLRLDLRHYMVKGKHMPGQVCAATIADPTPFAIQEVYVFLCLVRLRLPLFG